MSQDELNIEIMFRQLLNLQINSLLVDLCIFLGTHNEFF